MTTGGSRSYAPRLEILLEWARKNAQDYELVTTTVDDAAGAAALAGLELGIAMCWADRDLAKAALDDLTAQRQRDGVGTAVQQKAELGEVARALLERMRGLETPRSD
jgi:hypothetical protein